MSVAVPNPAKLSADAKAAADLEHKMGFRQAVRLYPKAIMFSFCLSLAVMMEGYDTYLHWVQTYEVSATWQTALSNGTAAAQIIGLFLNGIVSERIGYRWTMIGVLLFITGTIFITFFSVSIHMLLAGYILSALSMRAKSSKPFQSVKVDPYRSDNLIILPDEEGEYSVAEKKGF